MRRPLVIYDFKTLVGFFRWVFWVFLGGFFNANPAFNYTVKKRKKFFSVYKEIQKGNLVIYEEAVSHI
jgi:hypothetical protein